MTHCVTKGQIHPPSSGGAELAAGPLGPRLPSRGALGPLGLGLAYRLALKP